MTATSPRPTARKRAAAKPVALPDGFAIGQPAPESRYAVMDSSGVIDYSKLYAEAQPGYGAQVIAQGDNVTEAHAAILGMPSASSDE